MKLTVTINLPEGPQFLHQDFDPSFTIADLKSVLLDSQLPESFPDHSWLLRHNDNLITSDKDANSLQDMGLHDDDMLEATPQPVGQAATAGGTQSRQQQQQPAPGQGQHGPMNEQIEQLRQQFLNNPQARSDLQQRGPQLAALLNDPARFNAAWMQMMQAQDSRNNAEDQRLNNDVTSENQAVILERIRRAKIEADFEDVVETHPEFLGRVTMLYVELEVNGHPVKAFVDSGAQATIISPDCAEACGLTHLIDERYTSVARGVGTAKILGRIHKSPLKIGYQDDLQISFTVLEGKDVDMLLGLDMLKRYQACINLLKNCLEFPNGESVPFLPESEIPKNFDQEPTVEGPDGSKIGADSGAIKSPGATATPSASSKSSSAAAQGQPGSNFRGTGQSLGSSSSSAAQVPAQPQPQAAQPARPGRPTPAQSLPEEHLQTLMGIGATREQAVAALQSCGGNVDMAASLIFDSL